MTLLLTRKDVQAVLTMKEAIAAVEEGFRLLALGKVVMPQRTAIRQQEPLGLHLAMPASLAGEGALGGALGIKVVTVFPGNPAQHNLPTTLATMLLHDPRTGAVVAILDAGFLTAMRTGAASGVATRCLARDDARTLGIFGAGVQARTQLLAIHEVRRIERVVVCDPVREARERFAAEMSDRLSTPVTHTDDARRAAENDIVVTASSSKTPVFDGKWIKPGTHLNGIGSHSPDARELDAEIVRRSRVISDHAPARLAEDADFMVPIQEGVIGADHVRVNLGDVLLGREPGRRSRDEITLFKSGGLAVQDVVTAARVFQLARAAGIGHEVEI
jgi:ornithine cyclodeaminase/alanine dehydrogenase